MSSSHSSFSMYASNIWIICGLRDPRTFGRFHFLAKAYISSMAIDEVGVGLSPWNTLSTYWRVSGSVNKVTSSLGTRFPLLRAFFCVRGECGLRRGRCGVALTLWNLFRRSSHTIPDFVLSKVFGLPKLLDSCRFLWRWPSSSVFWAFVWLHWASSGLVETWEVSETKLGQWCEGKPILWGLRRYARNFDAKPFFAKTTRPMEHFCFLPFTRPMEHFYRFETVVRCQKNTTDHFLCFFELSLPVNWINVTTIYCRQPGAAYKCCPHLFSLQVKTTQRSKGSGPLCSFDTKQLVQNGRSVP